MKSAIFSLILLSALSLCYSYVYLEANAVKENGIWKCKDTDTNVTYSIGDEWFKKANCERASCDESSEETGPVTNVYGCGVVYNDDENCFLVRKPDKNYPDCCLQIECKPQLPVFNFDKRN